MLPERPAGWEWHRGLSTNGELYVMSNSNTGEVAIWIWVEGMPYWAILERVGFIAQAHRRLDDLSQAIHRGETTIRELADGMAADMVERMQNPLYGRF